MRYTVKKAQLGILAVLLMVVSPAMAENHFLLELNGGAATDVGVEVPIDRGTSLGLTFGFGGTVPGQSPAYYAVGRLGSSEFGYTGIGTQALQVDHAQDEWMLGGRVYLPLTDRIRVVLQAGFGQTMDQARVSQRDGTNYLLQSDTWALFGQSGLQYRIADSLSLGMAADLAIYPDSHERDLAAREASVGTVGQLGRAQVGLTGTFHF